MYLCPNQNNKNMITIRQATTQDIALIEEMAQKTFPATYKNIITQEQIDFMMQWMYSAESLQKQMTQDRQTYYIAYSDGVPAGYVSIRPEAKNIYHLEKIYVLPSQQGKNIGKTIFLHAVSAVKSRCPSPCQMRLNVNRNNKALHFYKKMGMKKLSEGDFDIGNGFFMNDYIMYIDL